VTWKSLLALGVSGGILPCPSALVVLLGAISLHRVGLGLLLVVAFSVGLAAVLTGIGIGLVWAGRWASRSRWFAEGGALRRVAFAPLLIGAFPSLSALAITVVGAVMIARAVMGESGGFGVL
jgi:ABC-type nickel/cobalt efflux system permease component RcnA